MVAVHRQSFQGKNRMVEECCVGRSAQPMLAKEREGYGQEEEETNLSGASVTHLPASHLASQLDGQLLMASVSHDVVVTSPHRRSWGMV